MTLYRALYQTRSGQSRRMTFSAASMREAHTVAERWQLRDDKLQAVVTIRPLGRPEFSLQANLSGV